MFDTEKLLAVTQLKISGEVEKFTKDEFAEYAKALTAFAEAVPGQEASLTGAVEAENYASYIQCLAEVWGSLSAIRAYDLAESCLGLMDALKKMTLKTDEVKEKIKAETSAFITALSTLSIDIQMALYKEEGNGAGQAAPEAAPEKKAPEDTSILAVDDSSFFLSVLKNCLSKLPYKLVCVTSASAAMRFLEKHTPDLIILDIEMPDVNGFDLAKSIKEAGFKAPIIFLTGNATKDNVLKAIAAGGSDYIVKPIDNNLVLSKIEKYLGSDEGSDE